MQDGVDFLGDPVSGGDGWAPPLLGILLYRFFFNPHKISEMELFHTTKKMAEKEKKATGALFDSICRESKIAGHNWIRGEQRVAGANHHRERCPKRSQLVTSSNPGVKLLEWPLNGRKSMGFPWGGKKKHDVFFVAEKNNSA